LEALAAADEADGEDTTDGVDLTIEGELADDGAAAHLAGGDGAGRGRDAEDDGHVEGRAFLAEIGGSEVDDPPITDRPAGRFSSLARLDVPSGSAP
jgi:hypothetical protein